MRRVNTDGWARVRLGGREHVVPDLCPNCMAPGTVPLRVGFKRPFFLVFSPFTPGDTQTFSYCARCAEGARAASRHALVRRIFSSFLAQIFLTMAAAVPFVLLVGNLSPLHPYWKRYVMEPTRNFVLLVIPVAGVMLGRWIVRRSLARQMRLHPRQEGQAAWGHAAYFVGAYGYNYTAARPEWIRALVEANPGSVDDTTWRQATGRDRPASV